MRRLAVLLAAAGLLATAAAAYLVANSRSGSRYVFESVPSNRRPMDLFVDTEAVPNVLNPLAITQELMDQWNGITEAEAPFGVASAGGPYNGSTVGSTFGTFTNTRYEAAWDDTGEIFAFFGLSTGVLGITLKSVDSDSGAIRDVLVVVNTQPGALVAPGTGATAEQLFRGTLAHELGHVTGLAHSPIGMANQQTFGLELLAPSQIPTMYPFRLPVQPQQGASIENDDRAGLIDIYPVDTSGLGSLSGTVRGASGAGINEISVRAIGPAGAGEAHVGMLTNEDATDLGRFTIRNLPPGAYRVVVEAVNGRGSVTGATLSSSTQSLGTNPFQFAGDELWQLGDTYDPANDDRTDFDFIQVRAGRDTGAVDLVLNARPLSTGVTANGSFVDGDEQIGDATGGFHFADYYVFAGTSGQAVTIDATGVGTVPQLRLLRPSDMDVIAEHLPVASATAQIALTLPQTGTYTVVLSARATTGNPGGTGVHSLRVSGATGSLPPVPPLLPAEVTEVALGTLQFKSPVCDAAMLQLHLAAPSHEELWVDEVTVQAAGTANDALDVTEVAVVEDRNGNGKRDSGEPVLGTGTFASDNGALTITGLDLELDAGAETDLLVIADMTVQSVSSAPQAAAFPWWLALVLVPLAWRRRGRRGPVWALVLLPFLLATCGGGGGSGCNGTFDPAGAVVTLELSVAPGDLVAFTSTSDPGAPLPVPSGTVTSATLSVSN